MPDARDEVYRLWTAVFGGPPAVAADVGPLCELLVKHLPSAPPYRPAAHRRPCAEAGPPRAQPGLMTLRPCSVLADLPRESAAGWIAADSASRRELRPVWPGE